MKLNFIWYSRNICVNENHGVGIPWHIQLKKFISFSYKNIHLPSLLGDEKAKKKPWKYHETMKITHEFCTQCFHGVETEHWRYHEIEIKPQLYCHELQFQYHDSNYLPTEIMHSILQYHEYQYQGHEQPMTTVIFMTMIVESGP